MDNIVIKVEDLSQSEKVFAYPRNENETINANTSYSMCHNQNFKVL